jgi:hypothetical protein
MIHTVLGPDGAWGLTPITAADETRLLWPSQQTPDETLP